MSRVGLDLSKFKKIKEDHKSAVLEHPEGHQITISKHTLSPKFKQEISKLPMHLADGGEISNEDLAAEAKQLNGSKNLAMNRPDEAMKSAAGYQPNFPEPTPVQMAQQVPQQAPVVINVGQGQQPQQSQAEVPQPTQPKQENGQPDFFTNGTFDMNKFAIHSPHVPIDAKIRALREMDTQEQQKQAAAQFEAKQQQTEAQKAMEYNQRAVQMGLPTVPVPNVPVMPNAVADAGNMQPGQMSQPQMAQQVPQAPQGPNDPYGTQAYYDAYSKGLEGQRKGIEGSAKAESQIAQEQSEALHSSIQQQQEQAKTYQEHFSALENERNAFQQDLIDKHVDSDRLYKNMSTGNKIGTIIGVLLGGFGALAGQDNAAMKILNQQIDNDINAQKADINKSENLLTANYRQFGNIKDAADMTKAMQIDLVKNQLAEAAAKSQDPLVKARAQQAIGQLDMQAAPILSQMAMRKALLSGMQSGQTDPSMTIRMIVPEGQQQAAYKELGEAQGMIRAKDNILGAFNQLEKINTIGGRVGSPLQTSKQVSAIKGPLIAQLSKETAGRFTEADSKFLDGLFPAPGDSAETIVTKRAQMNKLISEKMNFPMLHSYGIRLGNQSSTGRFGESGQKKIQLGAPVAMGQPKASE